MPGNKFNSNNILCYEHTIKTATSPSLQAIKYFPPRYLSITTRSSLLIVCPATAYLAGEMQKPITLTFYWNFCQQRKIAYVRTFRKISFNKTNKKKSLTLDQTFICGKIKNCTLFPFIIKITQGIFIKQINITHIRTAIHLL